MNLIINISSIKFIEGINFDSRNLEKDELSGEYLCFIFFESFILK